MTSSAPRVDSAVFTQIQAWLDATSSARDAADEKRAKKLRLKQVRAYATIVKAESRPLTEILTFAPCPSVYIHGIGASCGVVGDRLREVLEAEFGAVKLLIVSGSLPFVLCEFVDEVSANACVRQWHQQLVANFDRLVFVEFANLASSRLYQLHQNDSQDDDSGVKVMPDAKDITYYTPSSHIPSLIALTDIFANLPLYTETLFAKPPVLPGLVLIEDFISETEESELLSFVDSRPWLDYKFRRVQHYGHEFDYEINDIHRDQPKQWAGDATSDIDEDSEWQRCLAMFPPPFHSLIERCRRLPMLPQLSHPTLSGSRHSYAKLQSLNPNDSSDANDYHRELREFVPDQLTVNRYRPGDGIPPHCDNHSSFTNFILSLSLGADIVMEFNHAWRVILPRRSLLVLGHEARYSAIHAIQARKTDRMHGELVTRTERTSFTFRHVRQSQRCHCKFETLCDSGLAPQKKAKKHTGKKADTGDAPAEVSANGVGNRSGEANST